MQHDEHVNDILIPDTIHAGSADPNFGAPEAKSDGGDLGVSTQAGTLTFDQDHPLNSDRESATTTPMAAAPRLEEKLSSIVKTGGIELRIKGTQHGHSEEGSAVDAPTGADGTAQDDRQQAVLTATLDAKVIVTGGIELDDGHGVIINGGIELPGADGFVFNDKPGLEAVSALPDVDVQNPAQASDMAGEPAHLPGSDSQNAIRDLAEKDGMKVHDALHWDEVLLADAAHPNDATANPSAQGFYDVIDWDEVSLTGSIVVDIDVI